MHIFRGTISVNEASCKRKTQRSQDRGHWHWLCCNYYTSFNTSAMQWHPNPPPLHPPMCRPHQMYMGKPVRVKVSTSKAPRSPSSPGGAFTSWSRWYEITKNIIVTLPLDPVWKYTPPVLLLTWLVPNWGIRYVLIAAQVWGIKTSQCCSRASQLK